MVFISTVLTDPDSLPPGGAWGMGALSQGQAARQAESATSLWGNPARFNVAITRCKVRGARRERQGLCLRLGRVMPAAEGALWRGQCASATRRTHLGVRAAACGTLTRTAGAVALPADPQALLVVVGHPFVMVKDACWRELLRHCAARGTYLGAGSVQLSRILRQSLDGSGAAGPWAGGGLEDEKEEEGEEEDCVEDDKEDDMQVGRCVCVCGCASCINRTGHRQCHAGRISKEAGGEEGAVAAWRRKRAGPWL